MYQSPLRQLFSRKLFLAVPILFSLCLLMMYAALYLVLSSAFGFISTQMPSDVSRFFDVMSPSILLVYMVFVVILTLGLYSVPFVGCILIYRNARSGRQFKTAGFTLLAVFSIILLVGAGFPIISGLVSLTVSPITGLISLAICGLQLAVTILLVKAAFALRSYAKYGFTTKRIPKALPILMIIVLVLGLLSAFVSVAIMFAATSFVTVFDFTVLFPVPALLLLAGAMVVSYTVGGIIVYMINEARKALPIPETPVS